MPLVGWNQWDWGGVVRVDIIFFFLKNTYTSLLLTSGKSQPASVSTKMDTRNGATPLVDGWMGGWMGLTHDDPRCKLTGRTCVTDTGHNGGWG